MLTKLFGSVFGFKTAAIACAIAFVVGSGVGGKIAWDLQDGKVVRAQAATQAQRDRADHNYRAAKAWEAGFNTVKDLRQKERAAAIDAVGAANSQCAERVAEVRASSRAIKEILNAPIKRDPAGCPVRSLIGDSELRRILRPQG